MGCSCRYHVVLDFDCTVTEADTIGVLVAAAISRVSDEQGRQLRHEAWKRVVEAYKDDYGRHEAAYRPAASQRRTVEAETAWLASLGRVESASLERVGQAGIFEGFAGQGDFFDMGVEALQAGRVRVRRGLSDFVQHIDSIQPSSDSIQPSSSIPQQPMPASSCRVGTGIVSVNWSQAFIRGVLEETTTALTSTGVDSRFQVAANDVACPQGIIHGPRERVGDGISGGSISGERILGGRILATAAEKLAVMRHLVAPCEHGQTVYFGDSDTDLECLLYSRGVAIVPHQDAPLLCTLRRLRFQVAHMSSPLARGVRICWARDFCEVRAHFQAWIEST